MKRVGLLLILSLFSCQKNVIESATICKYYDAEKKIIKECKLSEDFEINSVNFAKNTIITFYRSSSVESGYLASSQKINNYNMLIGSYISFHENGGIRSGVLKDELTVDVKKIPAGSNIYFDENGSIKKQPDLIDICSKKSYYEQGNKKIKECLLTDNALIDSIEFKKDNNIELYESGRVKSGILKKETRIINIELAPDSTISFYEDGSLRQGFLYKEATINSVKLPSNSFVHFFNNGSLENVIIRHGDFWSPEKIQNASETKKYKGLLYTHEATINNIKLASSYDARRDNMPDIGFYESGELHYGILYDTTTISGITCNERSFIYFYPSGKLKSCRVITNFEKDNISFSSRGYFSPTSNIWLYESGQVEKAWLLQPTVINNITFSPSPSEYDDECAFDVAFYENGKIKQGFINNDTIIDGKKYNAGTFLTFADNGNIIKKDIECY